MDINRYEILALKTRREFPRFRVRERDKSWLRWIFWPLQKILRQNYASFTTTIFSTMYVGPSWQLKTPTERYKTLRHELVHVRQFHRWPFGPRLWVLNHLVMALCYLLVLPAILTFRAKLEREGYLQTLLVEYELAGRLTDERMDSNARWIAETFGGAAYFFMWRKKAAYAWAMDVQRRIVAGEITNLVDRVDPPRLVSARPL